MPVAALALAIAAAVSSWNPLAAPFGLVASAGALVLAVRALRRRTHRRASLAALVLAVAAALAGAVVLARTAGVGRELGGAPVVEAPDRADVESELRAAAERTRAARERARSELRGLEEGAPREGGRKEAPPP